MAKISKAQEAKIEEHLAKGTPIRQIAKLVGCSKGSVMARARRYTSPRPNARKPPVEEEVARDPPPPSATMPLEKIERIARLWEVVAVSKLKNALSMSKDDAIAAGVATQRFIECRDYIEAMSGLPSKLPEDDEEKREIILRGIWLRGRAGSSNAMKLMAEFAGVKHARQQAVKVSFDLTGKDSDSGGDT